MGHGASPFPSTPRSWRTGLAYSLLWYSATISLSRNDITVRSETLPAAIVVPPSGNWLGSDGSWSTFSLRVGNPPQIVNLLPSSAGWQTWVVSPQGCPPQYPVVNCNSSRGELYDNSTSTTWAEKGVYKLILESVLFTPALNTFALFGFETLGIGAPGSKGPSLDHQLVGAYASDLYYYVGIFGLSPKPTNFSGFADPLPSFLSNLKQQGSIPSLSFGYTAGAAYRPGKIAGSLTIGGYDASRFTPNDLDFTFSPDISRDIVVAIRSISTSNPKGRILMRTPIRSFIDSTLPYIYLPMVVCQEFERVFGLTWDDKSQLYLVNDNVHDTLLSKNPTITLELGNGLTGGSTVNINLPYASFDMELSYPLAPNKTRFFPLMRAVNESQYVLGRTFLQEAYLTVDWERQNFSVSQANFPDTSTQQHIVTIPPFNASANSTAHAETKTSTSKHRGLSTGAIVGIVIGIVIIAIAIITIVTIIFIRRKRRASAATAAAAAGAEKDPRQPDKTSMIDITPANKPELGDEGVQRLHEVDGSAQTGQIPLKLKLPLEEMEASSPANELDAKHAFPELEGQTPAAELEGQNKPVVELPGSEAAAELPATSAESGFAKVKRLFSKKSRSASINKGQPKPTPKPDGKQRRNSG